jgi:hypothetical protein
MYLFSLLVYLFIGLLILVQGEQLSFLGSVYSTPSNLVREASIQKTAKTVSKALLEALSTGHSPYGIFTANITSLSVTMTSVSQSEDDADDQVPILDFHFTSPNLNHSGVTEVNQDSVYRLGSVSKLFTIYALLLKSGFNKWNTPVTDILPELHNCTDMSPDVFPVDRINWKQVTIGSLASQLSGIGRDSRIIHSIYLQLVLT